MAWIEALPDALLRMCFQVHQGTDSEGNDLSGVECDLPDEIEKLIDKFDCEEMKPRQKGDKADEAERAFENLYPVSSFLSRWLCPWQHRCLASEFRSTEYWSNCHLPNVMAK